MRPLKELMNLEGRVVLITGGAGHIGSAMAEALAELGAAVAILDNQGDTGKQVSEKISKTYSVKAMHLALDLSQNDEIRQVPEKVLAQWDRIDILINCAALVGTSELKGWTTPFLDQKVEAWDKAMQVNLTAPFVLSQACTPALAASGHGSIINVGSTYGLVGPDLRLYEGTLMGNPAAYAASKGGLLQYTRWLATILAPNIRVNAITPGGVSRNQPDSFQKQYISRTPLQRMAAEEDFKGAAAYLASDASAYVTGHNLVVDGGWTAW